MFQEDNTKERGTRDKKVWGSSCWFHAKSKVTCAKIYLPELLASQTSAKCKADASEGRHREF
eukprot:1138534-Pelagomonas_calceolata.AAC.6